MDLIWAIAKGLSNKWGGSFSGATPSDVEYGIKKDIRSAEQIKNDLLNKLREG